MDNFFFDDKLTVANKFTIKNQLKLNIQYIWLLYIEFDTDSYLPLSLIAVRTSRTTCLKSDSSPTLRYPRPWTI